MTDYVDYEHMAISDRFHVTNLSELSKQIRDLQLAQFYSLYRIEKAAYASKLTDVFNVGFRHCTIIMTLVSIKYVKDGIREFYYSWEIDKLDTKKIWSTENSNL